MPANDLELTDNPLTWAVDAATAFPTEQLTDHNEYATNRLGVEPAEIKMFVDKRAGQTPIGMATGS